MQKRLLGILSQHRRHRVGMRRCHHSRRRLRRRHRRSRAVRPGRPPLPPLRRPRRPISPTTRPSTSRSAMRIRRRSIRPSRRRHEHRRPSRPQPWTDLLRQGSEHSPLAGRGSPGDLRRRADYTFKLRDAKYSNGDPIVAGDLVYAWKRLIDPRTAAKYQAFLADVAGGQALVDITGVTPAKSDAEVDALLAGSSASPRRMTRHSSSPSTTRPATSSTSSPCGRGASRRSGSRPRSSPKPRTTSAPARS